METVCQLDQDDPDILCHCKEHFPEILRLYLQLVSRIRQLRQLCDTVHQKSHLSTELFFYLLSRHDRVLNDIMQKSRSDRLFVELQIRQNDRHAQRMNNIWLTRLPLLILMCLIRRLIGFLDQ